MGANKGGIERREKRSSGMGRERRPVGGGDQPLVLVKWYDYTKWVLDRVDQFPKNQRWVLGTRLADAVGEESASRRGE